MSWHRWRETRRMHRNPWTCSRNDNGSLKRAHAVTGHGLRQGICGSVGAPGEQSPGVTEWAKFHRSMLGDVLCLCGLHLLEPAVVSVDNIEAVPNLGYPRVRFACQRLMAIECNELPDLERERFSYIGPGSMPSA